MSDVRCTMERELDMLRALYAESSRAQLHTSVALIQAEESTELPFEHGALLRSLRALCDQVDRDHHDIEVAIYALALRVAFTNPRI